jgi:hypothetical protein
VSASIYSPAIRREANLLGITDLQAYRMAKTREVLNSRKEGWRSGSLAK